MFHGDGNTMHLQHYVTEAELIWTGDVSHMTFAAASKMCSCNYFCAAFKCQFVHLDRVQFCRISQWHSFSCWKRYVLTIIKKKKSRHLLLTAKASFILTSPQLNELFRKSDVQKDFQSVRVKNLAPSNSIMAIIEAHFDPGNVARTSIFLLKP